MEPAPLEPPAPGEGRQPPAGAPRWVKVSAIVAAVVIVALVLIMVSGIGGSHGPGRHLQPEAGHDAPAQGVNPP